MILRPSLDEFQELFNNDCVLKMLYFLSNKSDKTTTSTQMADLLKIHVSTSKKYLDILHKYNFLTKENLDNYPGRPTLFTLKTHNFSIEFDLTSFQSDLDTNLGLENLNSGLAIKIREKKHTKPHVSFELDAEDRIEEIKVKIKTKARRFITKTIKLTGIEKNFIKYVPHPTMNHEEVLNICEKANIQTSLELSIIDSFVKKLLKYDVIETKD